jgi:glycerophosphoryl diester phosphodiesterase
MGIKYEYEKEGYDLDGVRYLPDFYLPDQGYWVEIKPDIPSKDEFHKAGLLAAHTQQWVDIFVGNPWPGEVEVVSFRHANVEEPIRWYAEQAIARGEAWVLGQLMMRFAQHYWGDIAKKYLEVNGREVSSWGLGATYKLPYWMRMRILGACPRCNTLIYGYPEKVHTDRDLVYQCEGVNGDMVEVWSNREYTTPEQMPCCDACNSSEDDGDWEVPEGLRETPRLLAAYEKARSARFEHGQKG